jgi:hypothetical protein
MARKKATIVPPPPPPPTPEVKKGQRGKYDLPLKALPEGWKRNPITNRPIKEGGRTHVRVEAGEYHKKA